MRRYLALMICGIVTFLSASGQVPIKYPVTQEVPPDSVDVAYYGRRHFWRAAGEVFGFNMGLWAFDRFVQHGDFAYISVNSIKENFRKGFKWDNDKLGTNMFLHPYNGSLYYNSARANGYNYWQSGVFALAGSAMWEMFMECEYPSTNDIIATPIGGMGIGEVCYRASDLVLDDRTKGAERFGREAAAFIISPMRGLTRILTGDAWRVRPSSGRVFGIPRLAVELSLGTRLLQYRHEVHDISAGMAAEINIEYGDRFDVSSSVPYDYFTFRGSLNVMKGQPFLSQLEIKGRLLARELLDHRRYHLSIGLYQHFDFYDSDTISARSAKVPYKLGIPASLGCGVMYRDVERHRWVFDAFAHVNAVILGSVLSDYYAVDCRNYNLASGFSVKGGANMVFDKNRFSVGLTHEYYRLFTWKGYHKNTDLSESDPRTLDVQGDHSAASFNVTELRADMRLWRKLYLTFSFSHYLRSTHYRDYPHVTSSSIAARLMVTYKF